MGNRSNDSSDRYRIGKLYYLSDEKKKRWKELGDVLAKQEKLLGFDHAEVQNRDLLNEIFLNEPS